MYFVIPLSVEFVPFDEYPTEFFSGNSFFLVSMEIAGSPRRRQVATRFAMNLN